MATSNAARQAAYRARHLKADDAGLARLNMVVSVPAKAQIERLSSYYAVTQREALETLLAEAERRLLESLPPNEYGRYYDRELSVHGKNKDVTQ